jgi:CubicO group peptidase (beta-lactamase class C family)
LEKILDDAIADGVTPGAACEVSRVGRETVTITVGRLADYDATGRPVTAAGSEPVREETLYDLASVSKLFTAITVLSLADDGLLDLDVSVAEWLPAYAHGAKANVTLAHLLSHTSGLMPTCPDSWRACVRDAGTDHANWVDRNRSDVLDDVLAVELVRPAGTDFEYSCLGYITSMAVAEIATGLPWSQLVRERVLDPLDLTHTTFTPNAARTAPTEYQPRLGRGMVRGVVHDENAYALGGEAGNAGLFAPVCDVTKLGSALLAGLPGVLGSPWFDRLWEDQLPAMLPDAAARVEKRIGFGQSLGLRIGQETWMSGQGSDGRGHTGFTGTSLLVDRHHGVVITLLTNRVHPDRECSDPTRLRRSISEAAYAY